MHDLLKKLQEELEKLPTPIAKRQIERAIKNVKQHIQRKTK
tara:strand:- start:26 stop:148 length:123 start_codon:yes stop_codon:yes gene_type:complete